MGLIGMVLCLWTDVYLSSLQLCKCGCFYVVYSFYNLLPHRILVKFFLFWRSHFVSAMQYEKRDFSALKAGTTVASGIQIEELELPLSSWLLHWKAASLCPRRPLYVLIREAFQEGLAVLRHLVREGGCVCPCVSSWNGKSTQEHPVTGTDSVLLNHPLFFLLSNGGCD